MWRAAGQPVRLKCEPREVRKEAAVAWTQVRVLASSTP
jgi:hypothetical protein